MPTTTAPAVVVIVASAGGVTALMRLVSALPPDFPAAVVIVLHRPADYESHLISLLARRTVLPVEDALPGGAVEAGTVYVSRPDQHLLITHRRRFAYSDGQRIRHLLSSANPLFSSSAQAFGRRAIGVVLTGTGRNGTDGVQAIKEHGGIVIVQNRATAEHFDMPRSAVATGVVDYVLPLDDIAPTVERLVHELTHAPHPPKPERKHAHH